MEGSGSIFDAGRAWIVRGTISYRVTYGSLFHYMEPATCSRRHTVGSPSKAFAVSINDPASAAPSLRETYCGEFSEIEKFSCELPVPHPHFWARRTAPNSIKKLIGGFFPWVRQIAIRIFDWRWDIPR
jgi:hypothetical protein